MIYAKCDGCGKEGLNPEKTARLDLKSELYFWCEGELCDTCAKKVTEFIQSLSSKQSIEVTKQ